MRELALVLLMAAGPALADDADALLLADRAPEKVEVAGDWHWFVEGALGQAAARNGGATILNQRLSFDLQLDKSLAPGWRLVFADQLDLNWQDDPQRQNGVNTLKELFLSWQAQPNRIADLGRINARYGVATGYNPTDYFRAGAVRSVVSVDPGSLKKNRLGSVMARGQNLWTDGSLTALFSPKLEDRPSDDAFSADLGATNNRDRWLLALSQRLTEGINPQFLAYGEQGNSPQIGFNLTGLANDSTVAFFEWSGGRGRSLLSQALNGPDDTAFRNRVAAGATYTSAAKLSLTLEYEYSGAGLDSARWDALGRGSPLVYGRYRAWQQYVQELPTRQELFLYAAWQDALINRLDLNAMLKYNVADHSRLQWMEARYHLDRVDLALQVQVNSGDALSAYGASAQRKAWQALVRYYF